MCLLYCSSVNLRIYFRESLWMEMEKERRVNEGREDARVTLYWRVIWWDNSFLPSCSSHQTIPCKMLYRDFLYQWSRESALANASGHGFDPCPRRLCMPLGTKPVCHNYWTHAQNLCLAMREAISIEKPAHHMNTAPAYPQLEKARA